MPKFLVFFWYSFGELLDACQLNSLLNPRAWMMPRSVGYLIVTCLTNISDWLVGYAPHQPRLNYKK